MNLRKSYPYLLIVLSLIGLLASFILTVDTIKFIRNPDVVLPCNINPLISCTSVASTWQSEVFGFSNSLLGIAAFAMLLAIGVMLSFNPTSQNSGRTSGRNMFWLLVNLGTLAAMAFVIWFFYQSVYNIGSLCLYCMATWAVTWPLLLYTTIWNWRVEHFGPTASGFFHFVSKYHPQILVVGYIVPILLILFRFKEFLLTF